MESQRKPVVLGRGEGPPQYTILLRIHNIGSYQFNLHIEVTWRKSNTIYDSKSDPRDSLPVWKQSPTSGKCSVCLCVHNAGLSAWERRQMGKVCMDFTGKRITWAHNWSIWRKKKWLLWRCLSFGDRVYEIGICKFKGINMSILLKHGTSWTLKEHFFFKLQLHLQLHCIAHYKGLDLC